MAVGLTQTSIQRSKAIISSVGKRSGRETDYSSLSTAWVKNECAVCTGTIFTFPEG
jgi:hypothetical protein